MLTGHSAIVTGGAGGIGKAVVQRFVQEGCKVVIADMNGEAATALAQELNNSNNNDEGGSDCVVAFAVALDVSNEEQVEACVKQAVAKFGPLTILVNNAAKFTFGHLLPPGSGSGTGTDRTATGDDMMDIMRVNLLGYRNFLKHAAEAMSKNELICGQTYENTQTMGTSTIDARGRGSIINVSSVSAYISQPEFVPYNCTKGAIQQLTRCCALDFAKLKIRVNGVCPGTIETDGSHNHMKLAGLSLDEGRKAFGDSCPMQRQAAPEEVAGVCLFLANPAMSSFVTGSQIVVDGGATMY